MADKKKLYQYDIEGNFIKDWNSVSEALSFLNKNPKASMKLTNKDYVFKYGFYWSFNNLEKLEIKEMRVSYNNKSILRKFKPIYQYDLEGNFIKKWDDILNIEKELGILTKRIYDVIYGRKKSSHGFRWTDTFYESLNDYYERHIFQYDIYGNFVKEWRNIQDILDWNNQITRANILSALEGKQKTCKNYQWSYEKVDNIGEINLYKRKSLVYVYTNNITNEKYVGQTRANVKSRAGKNGNGYHKSAKFWNAIQKYGWNNFSVEVIAKKLEQEDADLLEQALIEKYDSINNGYNTQTGGILSRVKK